MKEGDSDCDLKLICSHCISKQPAAAAAPAPVAAAAPATAAVPIMAERQPKEWLQIGHPEVHDIFFDQLSFTHEWQLNPIHFKVYVQQADDSTDKRWSPLTGRFFQPGIYVALWVGNAWLVPHGQPEGCPRGAWLRPRDDAAICTDGLHISLAYLCQLRDDDLERIKLLADKLTDHIMCNGDWPVRDTAGRWLYRWEHPTYSPPYRTALGTCRTTCWECEQFVQRHPDAKPGVDPFDTILHRKHRDLGPLTLLRADLYCTEGCFMLEIHSPLHSLCRGIQEFMKSEVQAHGYRDLDVVKDLHLTLHHVFKRVDNHKGIGRGGDGGGG